MPASRQGRTDTASRFIKAAPETIYDAFAESSALMAWLPPEGMSGRALEYELREGGRYRIELSYRDGARTGSGKTTDRTDISKGADNVPRGIGKADHDAGLRSSLENLARFVERGT